MLGQKRETTNNINKAIHKNKKTYHIVLCKWTSMKFQIIEQNQIEGEVKERLLLPYIIKCLLHILLWS